MLLFAVFLIAGLANPSPDPVTMLVLGGGCGERPPYDPDAT